MLNFDKSDSPSVPSKDILALAVSGGFFGGSGFWGVVSGGGRIILSFWKMDVRIPERKTHPLVRIASGPETNSDPKDLWVAFGPKIHRIVRNMNHTEFFFSPSREATEVQNRHCEH